MAFKELLQNELKEKLTSTELELLPSGYQQLSHILILNLKPELLKKKKLIATACLKLFPHFKTVLNKEGEISGQFREPKLKWVAGEKKFVVKYNEGNCLFEFDVQKIMWAKGNTFERQRLAEVVEPNEIVADFFAGIGYFSVPIAKKNLMRELHCFEVNPTALKFLKKNFELNKCDLKKIHVHESSCEKAVEELGENSMNRILLGYIPAPIFALPTALKCVKRKGIIHYEGVAMDGKPEELFKDVEEACKKLNFKAKLLNAQNVKSFGPKKTHYTLDVQVIK